MANLTPCKRFVFGVIAAAVTAVCIAYSAIPYVASNILLSPERHPPNRHPPHTVKHVEFTGAEVSLVGWHFRATGEPRGTSVYPWHCWQSRRCDWHCRSFNPCGFDVIAYDSRAQGESGGEHCTYGYYEVQDLQQVLNAIQRRPIILLGYSMGAAVALQASATDDRVKAVIAVETFSDLESVIRDRTQFFPQRKDNPALLVSSWETRQLSNRCR